MNTADREENGGVAPLLEVRQVGKRFPGVQALDGVDLRLWPGEVLALVGENGAGKSTLMKILAGIETPDEGQILLEGRPVQIVSPRDGEALGIALIHQELNLADNLSVGANMFLGREPHRWGFFARDQIEAETRLGLARVGLDVAPDTLVGRLAIGQQQLVEIARALASRARILIMDEPTSSLSSGEAERLFAVIGELRAGGVSVVYISHRLGEVKLLADRVAVLRDGKNAGVLAREQIDHRAMVGLMVGRNLDTFYARRDHRPGAPILEGRGVVVAAHPQHKVSFVLRQGEVVGLAGLVGAGRTELLRTLFGIDPALGGQIRVGGEVVAIDTPMVAIGAGMGLVPEDRKQQGLILDMAVGRNIGLVGLGRNSVGWGWLNRSREEEDGAAMTEKLAIKTPDAAQAVRYLSGGNQQKVVLAKWLALEPRVLLLDEPTRGIDVGAKEEIYQLMDQLAAQGVAILFASSEMEEVLRLSDRALIMHEGRISGILERDQLSEEAVMGLATGGSAEALL